MAKELPYFKFFIGDWLNGDITLEDLKTQGLFINICAYYWSKDCDVTFNNLSKKFKANAKGIEKLLKSNIIKREGDLIIINFLNEQIGSKEVKAITSRLNGLKGGRPKKIETQKKPIGLILGTQTEPNCEPKITQYKEEEIIEERKIIKEDPIQDFSHLELEVLSIFGFNDMPQYIDKRRYVHEFIKFHNKDGKLDVFMEQSRAYNEHLKIGTNIKYRFKLENFLGKQEDRYKNGKWLSENWVEKVNSVKISNAPRYTPGGSRN